MLSAVHCFTFPRSSFRVNINEAFHKNFFTLNFLFQPVHGLSIAISRIFTRNFQTISSSSVYSIPSYFAVDTTFRQSKKHRHPQAQTFWHMTNEKPIFHCYNGVFIFNILWLSSIHKRFFSHWRPYFWYI